MRHRTASMLDQALKGETRGDIPVLQPMKFELVNLEAGKAPSLKMPLELLAVTEEWLNETARE